jgi:DHA3 family macrolide efflux protein-like MFS transporter
VIAVDPKFHKWKQKFIVLWSGQAISIFTSSVIQMAIIWYLTDRTGSAAILSLATLAGFLPQAVLGPFIGVLIDRYNRYLVPFD